MAFERIKGLFGGAEAGDIAEDVSNSVKEGVLGETMTSHQNYGNSGEPLYYPLNLNDQIGKGREFMRIGLISRDSTEKKAIYLLTPTGLVVPDGSSWNNVDLGTLVGGAIGLADKAKRAFTAIKGGSTPENPIKIADIIAASTLTAAQKFAPNLLGTKGMMTVGLAANPYTSTQFAGTNLRTFEFSFKMISESPKESEAALKIENTFRKFLYPRTHPESNLVLVYPPLWKISFLYKGDKGDPVPNPYLPMIHFCNLSNMSVTYNATGNSFHIDGSPTEIDMSLSFMEAKTLTRDDLYGKPLDENDVGLPPNYDALGYDYSKVALNSVGPVAASGGPITEEDVETAMEGVSWEGWKGR